MAEHSATVSAPVDLPANVDELEFFLTPEAGPHDDGFQAVDGFKAALTGATANEQSLLLMVKRQESRVVWQKLKNARRAWEVKEQQLEQRGEQVAVKRQELREAVDKMRPFIHEVRNY